MKKIISTLFWLQCFIVSNPSFAGRDEAVSKLEELSKDTHFCEEKLTYDSDNEEGFSELKKEFNNYFYQLRTKNNAKKRINAQLFSLLENIQSETEDTLVIIPHEIRPLLINMIALKKLDFDFRYYGISFHTLHHYEEEIVTIINKKADYTFSSFSEFQGFLRKGDLKKPLIIGIEKAHIFDEEEKEGMRIRKLCKIIEEYNPKKVIIPIWSYGSDYKFFGVKEDRINNSYYNKSITSNLIAVAKDLNVSWVPSWEKRPLEVLIKFLDDKNIKTEVFTVTFSSTPIRPIWDIWA